jgi:hypothetical protein
LNSQTNNNLPANVGEHNFFTLERIHMTTRTLNQRLKTGELYVIFRGFGEQYRSMKLVTYGDPKRTPRIYGKNRLDDRVNGIPICKSLATAKKRLGPNTESALVPLAEMVFIFGAKEVRRWASVQGHVEPSDVLEYVAKN